MRATLFSLAALCATAAPISAAPSPVSATEVADYAEREQAAAQLESFHGGRGRQVEATTIIIVLLVVIVVLLVL
jgi:hypothetical protein